MLKKLLSILTIATILLSSCKKNLPDVGGTAAEKIANEWWVTLDQGGVEDVFGIGHFKMATYNTSANGDSIWVDDFKNGWGFKAKAKADYAAMTFAKSGAANDYYNPASPASFPLTVNITEGKVLLNVGHSRAGNMTDSIHFKVEFADDPGTIYEMNGHARTRFIEDEY